MQVAVTFDVEPCEDPDPTQSSFVFERGTLPTLAPLSKIAESNYQIRTTLEHETQVP